MASSVLATDGYKFSMAEAGWPLRRETFYYSHRRGGRQHLPVDVESLLATLWPRALPLDRAYLAEHEYEPGAGTWAGGVLRDHSGDYGLAFCAAALAGAAGLAGLLAQWRTLKKV